MTGEQRRHVGGELVTGRPTAMQLSRLHLAVWREYWLLWIKIYRRYRNLHKTNETMMGVGEEQQSSERRKRL